MGWEDLLDALGGRRRGASDAHPRSRQEDLGAHGGRAARHRLAPDAGAASASRRGWPAGPADGLVSALVNLGYREADAEKAAAARDCRSRRRCGVRRSPAHQPQEIVPSVDYGAHGFAKSCRRARRPTTTCVVNLRKEHPLGKDSRGPESPPLQALWRRPMEKIFGGRVGTRADTVTGRSCLRRKRWRKVAGKRSPMRRCGSPPGGP